MGGLRKTRTCPAWPGEGLAGRELLALADQLLALEQAEKHGSAPALRTLVLAGEVQSACVRLVADDTGTGMTPEQMEHPFRPFDRAGREHGRIPGVGLGLVAARRMAELMGGTPHLHSMSGRGTRAVLTLPAAAHSDPP